MDEGELSPLIREALIDRFEGWELVSIVTGKHLGYRDWETLSQIEIGRAHV